MAPDDDRAQQQTLAHSLGNLGGRQKSWMQAHKPMVELVPKPLPVTVKRRGRPPKKAAPPPNRPIVEPQANIQPPSNSTSPQLANTVARPGNVHRGAADVTVFPSPSPSEENMENALPPPPVLRGGAGTAHLDILGLDAAQASYAPETPLETVFMDSARRVSGMKRPFDGAGVHVERRGQPPNPDLARRPSGPQQHNGSPQLELIQTRSPSLGTLPNGHAMSPQLHQAITAQASRPFGPPRTLSRGTAQHLYGTPMQGNYTQSATVIPQQTAMYTGWYTSEDCLCVLRSFQETYPPESVKSRDTGRITVLKTAVEHGDWSYLMMHQYYCLLEYDPSVLSLELRSKPGLSQALRVMQDVLDTNKSLSTAVLHLFANFPHPLEEIRAKWPLTLESQTWTFVSFVERSHQYGSLKLTCEERRFPPVAWELAHHLGLSSPTFQRLLFTAVLRNIWRGGTQSYLQRQYEDRALDIFKQNQSDFLQRKIQASNGQSYTPQQERQDQEFELRHWGARLWQLVQDFESTLRSQGHPGNIAHAAGPPLAQQTPVSIQPSPHSLAIEAEMASRGRRPLPPHSAHAAQHQQRGRGRPRVQPVEPPQILPSQPSPQQARGPTRLLPAPGWNQPQQRAPNPSRFSLHQANLRSPVLEAQSLESPLYHFWEGYIKAPARLSNAGRAVETWTFQLDPKVFGCIAEAVDGVTDGPETRSVDARSKTVRLRCIKWPAAELPSEHIWAVTDTSWIPYSYFRFNDVALQQRKKVHHGKDLPIDITGLLREGENVLEMTVMAHSNDTSYNNYLIAIEFLGVLPQMSIKRRCLEEQLIPAEEVLRNIKSKMSGTGDNDDLAIVDSNITINLFDPFSASKICDIPVRSKACIHNDCFDLDTFLQTRRRKGGASVPDLWRCPICNADARPPELIVDGFLQVVKTELEAQGLAQTRAIIVQQDGSWKPKAEVRDPNGVSDRGMSDDPPTPVVKKRSVPAIAEVIDLSD